MVVRDKVVRLSSEVVTLLEDINKDIDQAIRQLLTIDTIEIKSSDVVTKKDLWDTLAKSNLEIFDKIDTLKHTQ